MLQNLSGNNKHMILMTKFGRQAVEALATLPHELHHFFCLARRRRSRYDKQWYWLMKMAAVDLY